MCNNLLYLLYKTIKNKHYTLLSSSSSTFVPPFHPPPHTIKAGSTTRPTTYETSDTGQQVNLLAPCLSDPTIYLAILYIFHLWCIFSIITKPSIHPLFHPSTIACPLSFSLACYNGPLRVDRRIYVGLYLWGREKNKGEKEIWKNAGGKGGGQSVTRKCDLGWCVCLSMRGFPSQQLASLNCVIEMTNRAAFFSFLRQLELAILSLASHSWSPRPWNWIWLQAHSWSDSMLVVRLFLESLVAVILTGVLCSFQGRRKKDM